MIARLAARLGWTEGQLYTLAVAAMLGVGLFVTGIPPALRDSAPSAAGFAELPQLERSELTSPGNSVPEIALPPPAPIITPFLVATSHVFSAPREAPSRGSDTRAGMKGPLRMRRSSYTSTAAGTPAASLGVPEGTLPIAARAGMLDKQSFLTLSGSGTALELVESDEPGANQLAERAAIRMCRVLSAGWSFERGSAHESAPVHDASACVDATRDEEGVWRFELSGFHSPDDDAGFALVPVLDAGATFQVSLAERQ